MRQRRKKPMKLNMFIACLCLLATPVFAENGSGAEVRWYGNYTAALKNAQEMGKPLLVSFRCVP